MHLLTSGALSFAKFSMMPRSPASHMDGQRSHRGSGKRWRLHRYCLVLQVVGFVVLVSGTSLYNELIRSCLPTVYESTVDSDLEVSPACWSKGEHVRI